MYSDYNRIFKIKIKIIRFNSICLKGRFLFLFGQLPGMIDK